MNRSYLLVVLLLFSVAGYGQKTISGKVTEEGSNLPLPGVSILIEGTHVGAITDMDGNYQLKNIPDDALLVYSFIGFITQKVAVKGRKIIDVTLVPDVTNLDEVVVAALNIKRDKTSLGYSVSQLGSDEVNIAKENNVMNSLSGKVSGLQIAQNKSGVDGSSRILLRGVTTIEGANRPLIVIDGIPVSNNAGGTEQWWGGVDQGDELSDINPDDIASISVLKGAGASAAYGSLGMHGVILITTKSGTRKNGIGVAFNSSLTTSHLMLTPDLQNEYGTGAYGQFAPIGSDGRPVLDYPFSWSWGPKMEGQQYTNWLGEQDTFTPQGNPYKEFYRTGVSFTNSLALQNQSDKSSFRLSITNQDTDGILEGNTLSKQTYNLRASTKLTDKLNVDGKVTYITSEVENRPDLAEGAANTSLMLSLMPRDIELIDVKNNTKNAMGNELKWHNDNYFNNPYWAIDNVRNYSKRDRFQGMFSLTWDVNDKINVNAKSGVDYLVNNFTKHSTRGSLAQKQGRGEYAHYEGVSDNWNTDLLATYKTDVKNINVTTSLGTNYRVNNIRSMRLYGYDSKVDGFYNISNYQTAYSEEMRSQKIVYSFLGLAQIGFKNLLYFDFTLRNDNSSALPKDNNSYWYHSENISFLFSELLNVDKAVFSRGKIRGSYARVGNDTSPYRTQYTYRISQTQTLPYPIASLPETLPSTTLRPETTNSWEVGAELGFFKNRLSFDFTYYQAHSTDQIMAVPISVTSGFSHKVINAGSIDNKGVELMINAIPVEKEHFKWDVGLTYTKSNSTVKELNEGLESITLNDIKTVTVEARKGEEFGSIYGYDFKRDKFGNKLISDQGLAIRNDERTRLGDMNPDFYGGITNNFNYRNWSLRTLISYQVGGDFYTYGRTYRMMFGTDARTLYGRETGIVEDGINENTGQENTVNIPAMTKHFTDFYVNDISSDYILDATHVKLKEVVLSYRMPSSMLKGTFIQGASLSLVARDLYFLYNAAGDIDPQSGYSSGTTGVALEHSALPSTRSFGVDLKLNF
ncbi:TonB-linked outer membrane protein, SusC/RagA family [Saccharicrinis carchari]|uniref:TonB-linked outer membrane protein, SusC/RagA family n=1 Tax=Saccharicrinis carchari TaxID=1168039 RepID=A0A521D1X0_SACCC|nr:SusC/RagA family TonB-linked outer membrane protein [Saccharicrinis carchari]SMO65674.1 TonB-linked outer membrane protein, SusC/RagA family [Saccharicrinis carchari]